MLRAKASVWGVEDKATAEYLKEADIHGRWLNLAAGDGRYNSLLLKKADYVVAADKDENSLVRLKASAPKKYEGKLETKVFDVTQRFPYDDNSFGGVFCTGTLHLFPTKVFRRVATEMGRILKSGGKIVIDFAADVRRIKPDGTLYVVDDEPQYSLRNAEKLMRETFKDYQLSMSVSDVPEEELKNAKPPHKFSCKFILLEAIKKK